MSKILILINIFTLIFCSNLSLRDEVTETQNIEINIYNFVDYNNEVGKKGTLVLEERFPENKMWFMETRR